MEILRAFSQYRFLPSGYFSYDSHEEIIHYDATRLHTPEGQISLLHEISHCELGHFHYQTDVELLTMEIAAWNYTRELARKYHVKLNEHYIADCIESYNIWMQKRGTCPSCKVFCLGENDTQFSCYNCAARWRVSADPQDRVVRRLYKDNS